MNLSEFELEEILDIVWRVLSVYEYAVDSGKNEEAMSDVFEGIRNELYSTLFG